MNRCYICQGNNFIDQHHYDCHEGKYSAETIPLCRRCHRTYHDWGVGAFSPDTTEKALEVENKRREIFGLPMMRLEDVTHSNYWYKKHNLPRPARVWQKKVPKLVPFRIPINPLCGDAWLNEHMQDYTPEQIAALTIAISYDGRQLVTASLTDRKRTVKNIVGNKR